MSNLVKTFCVFALPNIINTRGFWENSRQLKALGKLRVLTLKLPSSVQAMKRKRKKEQNSACGVH